MRKDVKFGLTIGAILVITLVIYVIVLSRSGSSPQKIALVTQSQQDQSATDSSEANDANGDSVGTAHTDDSKPDATSDADNSLTAPPSAASTPLETANNAPATQPAAAPQANSSTGDWQSALDHGLPPAAAAAPQRTVTPSIDSPASVVSTGINRSASTPMIDSIPATQPTRPLMADVPALDAPAESNFPAASPAPIPAHPAPDYSTATDSTNLPNPPPNSLVDATPTDTSPAMPANQPRTHRVMSGESPYSISQAVYGSGKYYKRILAANPGVNPHRLKIGQLLVIPPINVSETSTASAAGNNAAPAIIDNKSEYRVSSGDTLDSISRKLYGSGEMVDKIYAANKKLIGPNENVLKVGWVLRLPEAPSASSDQR